MRVLVLGSRGVIGSALVRRLRGSGHDVEEWDLAISYMHDLRGSSVALLRSRVEACDFVFFLAYDVGGSKYLSKPTLDFMNNNSKIMINTFTELTGKDFIFASSTMSNMDVPYGALKMVGEHYTKLLGGVVARFWNVYGPQNFGDKSHVLTDLVQSFLTTGAVKLRTDGREKRQFLHCEDCASCLESMMLNYRSMRPIVDVSSFEWITIYDAARLISENVTVCDVSGDSHSFNNEPDTFILNFWKPKISLKRGVEELIQLKKHMSLQNALLSSEHSFPAEEVVIHVKAPTRIDLAGGWTDIQPVVESIGGEVVAFAVNLYAHAVIKRDNAQHLHAEYHSTTSLGSGLGTSGAINVALMGAIDRMNSSREQIAERAFQLEGIFGNLGGRQDQYMAALGGFRHLTFKQGDTIQKKLDVSSKIKSLLETRLMLFDSGKVHHSGQLHAEIWAKLVAQDKQALLGISSLKEAAQQMALVLCSNDATSIGRLLRRVCSAIDLIDERIHAPFKKILEPLVQCGDIEGWKAVGAGAGGCVIILLGENSPSSVLTTCEDLGWVRLAWKFDEDGLSMVD